MKIGVISDTHDLVRPEALAVLAGSDLILHAGDICRPAVLEALAAIAPVRAVRGNNDRGAWADALPEARTLDLGGARIHLLHDVKTLAIDPVAEGVAAVVAGHSHRPSAVVRDGVLWFNPGSAGRRRFRLPVSVGFLRVRDGAVTGELVELVVRR